MINYNFGSWGFFFLLRCRGSVSRKGLVLAIPACVVCILMHYYYKDWLQLNESENITVSQVWSGYNWAITFLLAFRTNKAYNRYWEGISLLQQVRGEWFNATSSLIAFCAPGEEKAVEVERFQHLLVRLVSLLYCSGLQTVSDLDDAFRVIDNDGMEDSALLFLEGNSEKCEIILQWIQRLTMDMTRSGVVVAPPPIVSRVFQELSRGIVNLNNARKIADIPFPFPYAQMASILLGMHVIVAPIVAASLMNSLGWAVVLTFFPIYAFWGLNYIAAEIEAPFGDDPNDLPLVAMMNDMNTSLWMLLDRRTQLPPRFCFEARHLEFKSSVYSSARRTFMEDRVIPPVAGPELEPGKRNLKPVKKRQSRASTSSMISHVPSMNTHKKSGSVTVKFTSIFSNSSLSWGSKTDTSHHRNSETSSMVTGSMSGSMISGSTSDKGVRENHDQHVIVVEQSLEQIGEAELSRSPEVTTSLTADDEIREDTGSDLQRLRGAPQSRYFKGPRTDPNGRLPRRERSDESMPSREPTAGSMQGAVNAGGFDDRPVQLPTLPRCRLKVSNKNTPVSPEDADDVDDT